MVIHGRNLVLSDLNPMVKMWLNGHASDIR